MEIENLLWIDSHCHLDADEFAADRDAVVARARRAGVSRIVIPAVGADDFDRVADCAARYTGEGMVCYPAYGIHPLYVEGADDDALLRLRIYLDKTLVGPQPPVAIGEIGLDGFVPGIDPDRQERFFVEQLKIAREYGLPVLLHLRSAQDRVLKCLRQVFGKGYRESAGIAHAFNGSRQQADAFISLGFKLGFGGASTYDRSTRLQRLLAELPAETFVIETDAPDIPPVFADGDRRNEPAYLARVASILARIRKMSLPDFARQAECNTLAALPSLGPVNFRSGS